MRTSLLLLNVLILNMASAQICKLVESYDSDESLGSLKAHTFKPEERIDELRKLIHPDSIRFAMPNGSIYEDDEEFYYFDLDTSGIYLIDLDQDKDLDLIYSAQSGNMGLMSTAVYINNNGQLEKEKIIQGVLIDIYNSELGLNIYTLWKPCCDSYTNRLELYRFNKEGIKMAESISFVGRSKLRHVPDFSQVNDQGTLKKGAVFYAFRDDFRGLSPYFRDDNKAYKDLIKNQKPVPLMNLNADVKVLILKRATFNDVAYVAVITDAFTAPKSHYEWSAGPNRRFVGWVKEEDLK